VRVPGRMVEVRVCSPLSAECSEDLIAVINSAFNSFRHAGMTPERMRLIAKEDDGVGGGRAYVAYVGGEPASAVQVVIRDLTLGGDVLSVAGIANVGTVPRFRGRGLAKLLMNYVLSHVKEVLGLSAAALFAGVGSVAHRIYVKLGFKEVWRPLKLMCGEECLKSLLVTGVDSGSLNWYVPKNPEPLSELYEEFSRTHAYAARRSSKYWCRVLKRNPHYTWFHSNPEDIEVCETRAGNVVAYYAMTTWRESDLRSMKSREDAYLKELLCVSNAICASVLSHVAEKVLGKGLTSMTVDLPNNHPALNALRRAGAEHVESDEVFMVKHFKPLRTPRELGERGVIHVSIIDRW